MFSLSGFFDPAVILWAGVWAVIIEGLRFAIARRRLILSILTRELATVGVATLMVSLATLFLGTFGAIKRSSNYIGLGGTSTAIIPSVPAESGISPYLIVSAVFIATSICAFYISNRLGARRAEASL